METSILILQIVILISLIILFFFGKYFFPSYLKKKGENLATKEDISEITTKIQEIKSNYASELEVLKSSLELANLIRTGALDKRIEKYQEAFTLWLELFWSLRQKDIYNKVSKCQEWWNNNCLYLDEKSRGSFKSSFLLAGQFNSSGEKGSIEFFKKIEEAGQDILRAINLPAITKNELKKVEVNTK